MSIEYNVRSNKLTNPPSYSCQPSPRETLGLDKVAQLINIYNPTITPAMAKTVLENFREITLEQVADGKFVKIERFVSFAPRMPVKLVNATDPLPSDAVRMAAKVSQQFDSELVNLATFSRIGYPVKSPEIISEFDTTTDISKYFTDGYPFKLSGKNLFFDSTDTNLGVFVTDAAGTEMRQAKIGQNDPSNLIITADFTGATSVSPNVEKSIYVKTKYTENGSDRQGSIVGIRSKNTVTSAQNEIFVAGADATGGVQVVQHVGVAEDIKIRARFELSGTIFMSAGTVAGEYGPEVQILNTGGQFTLTGPTSDVVVEVADNAAWLVFKAFLLARDRYVVEVCNIDNIV